MPIYGYVCKSCGHRFDVLQKMSDDPLVHCPDCGEPKLQKELSAPKFRLKGQGWYETDFKTGDKRNLHGGDKGGDKGRDKKEPSKSDTKKADKKADTT
ncbi:MAG: zinc ribbon domain-containing protein [Woeseiaceae bacterium]|nr:zinc ribbon domain-containing protein [Woeseiaceae bacterium]